LRLRPILLALLGAHVLWCLARIPHAVFSKRAREVAEFRALGGVEYLLARNELSGAEVVRSLQRDTPERCAVLFAGEPRGVLEFAAALLWPRLLVDAKALPGVHEIRGIPFARGTVGGVEGELVLHATRERLWLELRR
jgi:hypothetical protein